MSQSPSPMPHFLDALRSGRILLMDGAMGTELRRAGLGDGECGEAWNLSHPERVLAVYRAYVAAGAECLLANTFQSNLPALARHGLAHRLEEINHAAVELARSAAGPRRFVLADVGPVGEPLSAEAADLLLASFAGADGILLETCSDLENLKVLHQAQRGSGRQPLPFLFSATYWRSPKGLRTWGTGYTPEFFAQEVGKLDGVVALGVNCGRDLGMSEVIEVVQRYRAVTDLPLFARPNAGTPARLDGRWVYPHGPEAMAARLPDLLRAGGSMVGGCCGTTPEHIAVFRACVERNSFRSAVQKRTE